MISQIWSLRPFALALLLGVSLTACSSLRHREEAEAPKQVVPDLTQQKIENLSIALSKAQGRIEELDAKLSALHDTLEGTKTTVENLAGPKDVKTVAIGANADGVPESEPTAPASDAAAHKAKAAPAKAHAGVDREQLTEMSGSGDESIPAFAKAMNLFRKGNFSDAVLAFNHYVESFPDKALAGSAQYHAAESYFMMKEYKLALPEYQKVVSSFGNSPRVPSALMRIAHVYQALGDHKQSQKVIAYTQSTFPNHPCLDWPAPASNRGNSAAAAAAAPAAATAESRTPQSVTAVATTAAVTAEPTAPSTVERKAASLEAGPMEPESPQSAGSVSRE